MAKLIVLALAFAALVAFASAHRTIVTTTIENDKRSRGSSSEQCRRQVQQQQFNQCRDYLQQGQGGRSPYQGGNPGRQQQQQDEDVQQCCEELQNVDEQCQCEAVQEVFKQARRQQQQQGQQGGGQGSQQLKQRAQNLPNQCNLQTRQCQIRPNIIITTTTIDDEEDTFENPQQQCQQRVREQSFNQCQRYLSQRTGYQSLLMGFNRQSQQHQQSIEQCCQELRNVEQECQCEAVQEVFQQTRQQIQQQQHQGGRQQPGRRGDQQQPSRRGDQQQQQVQDLRRMAENLPNQCNLEVQQCRVSSF